MSGITQTPNINRKGIEVWDQISNIKYHNMQKVIELVKTMEIILRLLLNQSPFLPCEPFCDVASLTRLRNDDRTLRRRMRMLFKSVFI